MGCVSKGALACGETVFDSLPSKSVSFSTIIYTVVTHHNVND